MSYEFTLTEVIPATPQAIYDAWLDSAGHSAMTGGTAEMSAMPGAAFTAWDGYLYGRNLELAPHESIVQSWRTTQFPEGHEDSKITVTLTPAEGGTLLKLVHSGVPEGQTSYEKGGWQTHYFEPMKKYFSKRSER